MNTIQVNMSLWGKTTKDTTLNQGQACLGQSKAGLRAQVWKQLELRQTGWPPGRKEEEVRSLKERGRMSLGLKLEDFY